ncbi:YcaO-like family protein [Plantactinospora sp. CA-294935]|uniref:YcaO-like family protein n=1 Tax=Plantactinospora sp. CA-294935 TaxID=3240012 RepID=UPI003D8B31E5
MPSSPTEEAVLAAARAWSASVGVTRSSSITRLDRIGVPVAMAVRPGALAGSLVVTGGKGTTEAAAEIGARLEAVELAAAEHTRSQVPLVRTTYRAIAAQFGGPAALLRLCPRMDVRIPLDEEVTAAQGTDLCTAAPRCLPSELVLLPPPPDAAVRPYFGASSFGLGCGLTLEQATMHAMLEVLERDALSFPSHAGQEWAIDECSLPDRLKDLVVRARQADVAVRLLVVRQELGLPVAHVVLWDRAETDRRFVNGGHACARSLEAALERALLEALQSRAAFMHGGREDLPSLVEVATEQPRPGDGSALDLFPPEPRGAHTPRPTSRSDGPQGEVEERSLSDVRHQFSQPVPDDCAGLADWLAERGVGPTIRFVLRDGSMGGPWVVRTVIVGCESYVPRLSPRVGPRLAAWSHG